MRSPALTSSATRLPFSSRAPGPTAITSPSCGFSLAVSGMMMPPAVFSVCSTRRTSTRSCKGRKAICRSPIVGAPERAPDQVGGLSPEGTGDRWHSHPVSANDLGKPTPAFKGQGERETPNLAALRHHSCQRVESKELYCLPYRHDGVTIKQASNGPSSATKTEERRVGKECDSKCGLGW